MVLCIRGKAYVCAVVYACKDVWLSPNEEIDILFARVFFVSLGQNEQSEYQPNLGLLELIGQNRMPYDCCKITYAVKKVRRVRCDYVLMLILKLNVRAFKQRKSPCHRQELFLFCCYLFFESRKYCV